MKLVSGLLLIALLIIANGYVIQTLWQWFLVPLGLISITMSHAYGLSIIATCMTGVTHVLAFMKKVQTEEDYYIKLSEVFLTPFCVLSLGFIVKTLAF